MCSLISATFFHFLMITSLRYVLSLPEQTTWKVVLNYNQNTTTAHRSLYGNSSVWLTVSCDSEEDNVEMTYVVVLSESQCIARPLGTDVTLQRAGTSTEPLTAAVQCHTSLRPEVNTKPGRIYMTSKDSVILLHVQLMSSSSVSSFSRDELTLRVRIVSPIEGNLSPIDWPLLPFYGMMCCVYAIYALVWLTLCFCYWSDLLRIQYWIAAVIFLGMLEKAFFVAEYDAVNKTGASVEGLMIAAELVSCLKRTLARMLFIVVSLGFGIVRPRLGNSLHHVVLVGVVYLVLGSFEGIRRVITHKSDTSLGVMIPAALLSLLDLFISLFIMKSLIDTIRLVALRKNVVKLALYKHFRNTLIFAILASVSFMLWSTYQHKLPGCSAWQTLWLDEAFWHILFSLLLAVVMFLWRPSANNQRYAYSAAVDEVDEDSSECIVHSSSSLLQDVKKVGGGSSRNADHKSAASKKYSVHVDETLQWVDDNIPSSAGIDVMLPGLLDSDDELRDRHYQLSKMQ